MSENRSLQSATVITEEDTFNRLRRRPFRELFIEVLDPIILGDDIIPENRRPRIEEAGWNFEAFISVMLSEIDKENITGDASTLMNPVWRAKFLKLPSVY